MGQIVYKKNILPELKKDGLYDNKITKRSTAYRPYSTDTKRRKTIVFQKLGEDM